MRYRLFFLLVTPILGSRLELFRKFSIFYVVLYVRSRSKSVKTTRPYHKSFVLKRKRVGIVVKINRINNHWKTSE